jgi:hypothetical protein
MRRLFLALLIAGAAQRAEAEPCTCTGRVWPKSGDALPANGRLLLVACGVGGGFADQLTGLSPKLVATGDEIPLSPGDTFQGVGTVEVLLTPERALKPKLKYVLQFDPARVKELEQFGLASANGAAWTAAAADKQAPGWGGPASISERSFSSGSTDATVTVKVAVKDKAAQVIAELEQVGGTAGAAEYQLPVEGGKIVVGAGLCGGSFNLTQGARYQLRLRAVDAAGNSSPAPNQLEFEAGSASDAGAAK